MARPVFDMLGVRVGRLVVSRRGAANSSGNIQWVCLCDCGKETEVRGQLLRTGVTKSCGCLAVEKSKGRASHGHARVGLLSPEYRSWLAMKKRCGPNYSQRHLYGGRGIMVCERWMKFDNFFEDMGRQPSPEHRSIDRYPDNDGNYEPGNCRWATRKEQGRNKRSNRIVETGECVAEVAERSGLAYDTVYNRIAKLGWSVGRASGGGE